ncbi:MAG TPA: Mur ligase family protein [Opitutaceae bacterium]|nr:Mur ligase family protein [Opitutaceae bacterium]
MKIYFMGIGGTAMGNAALLARAAGHEVLGADAGVYPPMSTVLAEAGISVHEGYDPGRLERLAPDLVVIGNAMSRGNSEVEWLLDTRALRFTSLPALLHESVLDRRCNVVVCGTHGKTTTTAMTAYLLRSAGGNPGFLIGGVPQDPPTGAHLGSDSDPFVIEGDEYDSAFFDKRSKFIHYAPRIAVLNNLEFDHADIFRDLADVQRTFVHLCRIVPRNGCIVMNGDDLNLQALGPMPWTRVIRVGTGETCDVRIVDFSETAAGATFGLRWRGNDWTSVSWALPGLYNARNAAMAATAAGLVSGRAMTRNSPLAEAPAVPAPGALSRFRGVRRRQEVLHESGTLTIIEDFGHHPTALAETLHSFRARFPGARLTAVFEPRSNTARTKALQPAFMRALAAADDVYIGAVNRAEKIEAAERFDPEAVIEHLAAQGIAAHASPTNAALLERLTADVLGGATAGRRVVIFFSNGSFDGIIARFAAEAGKRG